ncbi:MAG: SGNH/GDSL hydrolase family protein, partial [Desulfobacterales bacterium]|nr:SGNH/GDSL hydrolase family protein [Desulfobacterales bacterium]
MPHSKEFRKLLLPASKMLLFAVLTLFIFFVGVESALTLIGVKPFLVTEDPFVGFAKNIPLFVEQPQSDGTVMLATADNKLSTFNPQQFPKERGPTSYRIFCMGGSTTYGRPYDDSTSFCGWLREFLRAADPSRNWEVINAGGISYASYRVTALMEELSQYQPDLFIIYSGHNEFLEERTYRKMMEMPDVVVRINSILSRTRIYTAMKLALDSILKSSLDQARKRYKMTGEVDEILDHT